MMTEQFVRVEGYQIRILANRCPGSSSWMVLWPGLGGAAEEFIRLLREAPEHGWNVAAFDAPGHGRSDPWNAWSGASVMSAWDGVLQFLGSPCHVVAGGHSAGAYFAVTWATHRPHCGGLVLWEGGYLDPFPEGTDMDAVHQQNASYLQSRRFLSWEEFLAAERGSAARWDGDAELMLRAQMVERDGAIRPRIGVRTANQVTSRLADYRVNTLPVIRCPVLLAVATLPSDLAAIREDAISALRRRVPALDVVYVPKAGHDLLIDNPEAVSTAVWAFLAHRR